MKTFGYFIVGGIAAALCLAACTDDSDKTYDEAYYAAHATVSCDDSAYTADNAGGTVRFTSAGGSVAIHVDCEVGWTVENNTGGLFGSSANNTAKRLTVAAQANYDEEEKSGTVTLKTSESGIEFATVTLVQDPYSQPEISVATTEWQAPAEGTLTTEIAVSCSIGEFTVKSSEKWLTAERTDGGVSLTADINSDYEERSADVVLTANDGYKSASVTIIVTQDAHVFLETDKSRAIFCMFEDSAQINVDSNFDWDWTKNDTNSWYSVSRDGNALIVTCTRNSADRDRTGSVTITAGDGEQNVSEVEISVIQTGPDDLMLVYTTESDGLTVQLPLYDTVNCLVDWGDEGEMEVVSYTLPTHTYKDAGEYRVRVTGTVTALRSTSISSTRLLYLTGVSQWGSTGLTNMASALCSCSNLTSLPQETGDSFAEVTSFSRMLYCDTGLTSLPADLFANNKATDMSGAFIYCIGLKELPQGLFANCSEVTTFEGAFYYCYTLQTIPSGLFAGLSKVTTFESAFYHCSNLGTIPEDTFKDCSAAESFASCFFGCSADFTSIPAGLFSDCSAALDFSDTFAGCTSLASIPAGLFDSCRKVESFSGTFQADSKIEGESPYTLINGTKVHLYERSDYKDEFTSQTIDGSGCFGGCTKLSDYSTMPSSWK